LILGVTKRNRKNEELISDLVEKELVERMRKSQEGEIDPEDDAEYDHMSPLI
jgi:hypothetical protein